MKAFKKYTVYDDDNDVKISYSNNSNAIHQHKDIPRHGVVIDTIPLPYITKKKEKNSLDIRIKYWPGMPLLEQWACGDWCDLYSREDITLQPDESTIIHLGVAMKLPEGYEAHLAPRSSTFKRWGLIQTNSVGIIDSSYCGNGDEWGMPVYATKAVTIPRGTRLCQFRIMPIQPKLNFIIATDLGDKDRGGFGSSGV